MYYVIVSESIMLQTPVHRRLTPTGADKAGTLHLPKDAPDPRVPDIGSAPA